MDVLDDLDSPDIPDIEEINPYTDLYIPSDYNLCMGFLWLL